MISFRSIAKTALVAYGAEIDDAVALLFAQDAFNALVSDSECDAYKQQVRSMIVLPDTYLPLPNWAEPGLRGYVLAQLAGKPGISHPDYQKLVLDFRAELVRTFSREEDKHADRAIRRYAGN